MPFLIEKMRSYRPLSLIFLSLTLHFLFFVVLPFATISIPDQNAPQHFEIESIDATELKRLRTLGIKDGSKYFSEKLSLSQLSTATLGTPKNFNTPTKKNLKDGKEANTPFVSTTKEQKLPDEISVAVKFDPPEGVPEDELNALERVLFGFNKRLYKIYVSAVFRTFNSEARIKPFIINYLNSDIQTLSATVLFDANGDLIKVFTPKGSHDYYLVDLFKRMLENMNTIPNPPKYLTHDKKFKMDFTLRIGRSN